jgi:hypothetical protein
VLNAKCDINDDVRPIYFFLSEYRRRGLAKQLGIAGNAGSINLLGVGGNQSAPLANVSMKIENQPPF